MSSRIPPLLTPYVSLPPEGSLTVVTGVLGASPNWLVLRFLYSLLRSSGGRGEAADEDVTGVVLVSFMRDGAFWREGAGKIGLDLDAASRAGRFSFVDGLTSLFTGGGAAAAAGAQNSSKQKQRVLRGGGSLQEVRSEVDAALGQDLVEGARKVLVVDQIDALLAATGDQTTSLEVQNLLLALRESTHSTFLTLAADTPLLHAQATTLEREHAALVLSQAHAADTVMALRMLDTGVARDVSGVVRVTRRRGEEEAAAAAMAVGDGGVGDEDGAEFLYYVGADGGVKVFERGA